MIISGEQFQLVCDIWCGFEEDFRFNPLITRHPEKHFDLQCLTTEWDNPYKVFCYAHRLSFLQTKLHLLKNNFILVTHNSDENITDKYIPILSCPKLVRMYSQNPCIIHPRLSFLPIGIANSMWAHGAKEHIHAITPSKKTKHIYFYFNLSTNRAKRTLCKDILEQKGLQFMNPQPFPAYIKNLSEHRFCVCPEGNGIDTHRLWECYYANVIPILIRSAFTSYLVSHNLPCILVDRWEDLDVSSLTEEMYVSFDNAVSKLEHFLSTI